MKIKILLIYSLLALYSSCNYEKRKDENRIIFFEKEGAIDFPSLMTIIKYEENIEIGSYFLKAKVNGQELDELIEENQFKPYSKKVIGKGINFSQDEIDLTNFEIYFNLKKNSISRNDSTYFYRNSSRYKKFICVVNIGAKIVLVYLEK